MAGTPLYTERIRDGWYQLPGDTAYYGADLTSFANVGAAAGRPFIDSACGPIGKAVYDAAHIADPEIDYSDYDTDKDGVVDFFMMVFVGIGGNGASQTVRSPPYDNIWPHSSSLEYYLQRPETTGLHGLHLRRPAQGPRGPAALLHGRHRVGTMTTDADRVPGLRPRRPVQRQPRVGDRQGERDLARVRPLARAARLLLDSGTAARRTATGT